MSEESQNPDPFFKKSVKNSPDLARILAMPRRTWTEKEAEDLAKRMTELLRLPTGTQELRPAQAMSLHDLLVYGGLMSLIRVGGGKSQPNDEPIHTALGWKSMGELRVGDRVHGRVGLTYVTGVFPQGIRPVRKVIFSDGSWTRCDPEHLWTFYSEGWTQTKTCADWEEQLLNNPDEGIHALLAERQTKKRHVVGFESQPAAECTCISVDAPDHLYQTRFGLLTHNTLVSFLAPYVSECRQPLLLIPANLREKTERDRKRYREHWEIGGNFAVESYEMLARKQHAHYLSVTKPDIIICDEAHHLKNTKAAVTRRLKRYLHDHPETKCVFMSGTLTNTSLKEYQHLLRWALKDANTPLPTDYDQLDNWSLALDEKIRPENRVKPGALVKLCNEEERDLLAAGDELRAARLAYRRRLTDTPGVVATRETFMGASLNITPLALKLPQVVEDAFKHLREKEETPDGWPISDGHIMAKHAKELALGFYYRWNPRPPAEWVEKRKAWCAACRKILTYNKRGIDTEDQAKQEVRAGQYPDKIVKLLDDWTDIEKTFIPNIDAVWLHDFALEAAADWAKKNKGIVWVYHSAFGRRLAEMTGLRYYKDQGYDAEGQFIESHSPKEAMIASISSNKEGKNLQSWCTNLMVHPPSSGIWWEQVLGRTHRDGQEADEVSFEMYTTCVEHVQAFWDATSRANYTQDTTGQVQKLLYATVTIPTVGEVVNSNGCAWTAYTLKAEESAAQ